MELEIHPTFLQVENPPKAYLGPISEVNLGTAMSKSVANPWRDRKIAVLAGEKAVKSWIRPLRGK
jgi:hypothetical protein